MAVTTMFAVARGEQYAVEIVIYNGDTAITPLNVDDIKINLGSYVLQYSKGEISYENGRWQYPITQEMSLEWDNGIIDLQGQYKVGDNIYNTEIYKVKVDTTTIEDIW